MEAVVLAEDRGVGLHPLAAAVPVALVPILGRPLLGRLLTALHASGVTEAFVVAGSYANAIADFLRTHTAPMPVHVVRATAQRGGAGAVADLLPHLRGPFLVVEGKALLDLDLDMLETSHRMALAQGTLATASVSGRLRHGVVTARGARVEALREAPPLLELAPDTFLDSGCYLLERRALADVPTHGVVDFARDVFPRLLEQGARLAAAPALRYWRDAATPEAYLEIHLDALGGDWPWEPLASMQPDLGPGAQIVGPVVCGRRVSLGPEARLVGPAYCADGVVIGPGAHVTRSVLLEGGRIGAHADISDIVVDAHAVVPAGAAAGGGILGRRRWPARPAQAAATSRATG